MKDGHLIVVRISHRQPEEAEALIAPTEAIVQRLPARSQNFVTKADGPNGRVFPEMEKFSLGKSSYVLLNPPNWVS